MLAIPFHDALPFDTLHKARFDAGLNADLPASPEGAGDIYWAPDANSGSGALYIADEAGTAWISFSGSSVVTQLNDLSDVDVLGATNTQVLAYNSVAGEWQAQSVAQTVAGLQDTNLAGLTDGDVMIYDGVASEWIRATKVNALGDLVDVSDFVQSKGDIMASDGGAFGRLPVGSDNLVLIADSGETLGVKWGTSFDASLILTNEGEVLVDGDGNVITESF